MKHHAPLKSILDSLWSFWKRGRRVERIAYAVGSLLLLSGLVHVLILLIGGGSWEGPLSLRKPASFGVSFGMTLITVAWVASFLSLGAAKRNWLLGAFSAASVIETALVSMQTWRGVPSHFNVETTFDALVARSLAAFGFVLVVVIVALTFAAFRRNRAVPASLRVAIQVGFVVLCASLGTGGVMIARGMSLVSAGNPTAAYATGGALKPIHAVTMHAILVLPALAWLLSFVKWNEQSRLRVVIAASAGYIELVGIVAGASFAGLGLHHDSALVEGLLAAGVLTLIAATTAALVGLLRTPANGIQHA